MGLNSTIKAIKSAGFGYIKVELEAQLRRPYGSDEDGEYETCPECDGCQTHTCEDCDGNGYTEVELSRPDGSMSEMTEEITCESCDGDGAIDCSECDGEGEIYREGGSDDDDFGSVERCQRFIMEQLSDVAKKAIIYGRFYNDGSVDSEYTFTIAVEDVHVLPEIVDSFNKLAEAIGNGMEVDGAGMHVAVLPQESNGVYPVRNTTLDPVKLANFQTEVTKLLPALFVAATSGNFTRAFNYRMPQIANDKYSAIHIVNNSCLEFRLFETCYQRPEAIFEYLQTIARTLEFYKDPSKKVALIGKQYSFYEREGLKGLTSTPDQVRIIKKQLKMVIGKDITFKKFQEIRELQLSVGASNKDYSKSVTRTRKMYLEALKDFKHNIARPLNDREVREMQEHEQYGYFDRRGTNMTHEDKVAYIRGLHNPGTIEQFINRNVLNMRLTTSLSV